MSATTIHTESPLANPLHRAGIRHLMLHYSTPLLLAAAFLLALGLRSYCLDCHNLWYDEIVYLEAAQRGPLAVFTDRFGWMYNETPWRYMLTWLTAQIADPAATSVFVRLPSVLAGSLLPVVVYALGLELFGRAQGLLAALLTLLSVPLLSHSQEARPYAIIAFLTALSVYSLVIAERTGQGRWWLAFALAASANILHAYAALTMVMPALTPYLLWLLWKLLPRKRASLRPFLYALISMASVTLISVPMLIDIFSVPTASPDPSRLSFSGAANLALKLLHWFTSFGIGGRQESFIQLLFLLLAIVGAYLAITQARAKSVALCGILIAIPALLLALLSTTNIVFERYALFALPFHLLLIANGVVSLFSIAARMTTRTFSGKLLWVTASFAALFAVSTFVLGAANYLQPNADEKAMYRPDFRGAAAYLEPHARPQDTIIFADEPSLGYAVSQFYWHSNPPAATFDARDPRLFAHTPRGNIYWVVSTLDLDLLARLSAPEQDWAEVARFDRVVVLREDAQPDSLLARMDRFTTKIATLDPHYKPVLILRGGINQARGNVAQATRDYINAGTYYKIADEYLLAATGYLALGQRDKAYREALMSKFLKPDDPKVHAWLAQQLRADGYIAESMMEEQLASALRTGR
ncbi:MAG TPA: glycosyltransferase family 39 protein [Chloroflexia bacterium]